MKKTIYIILLLAFYACKKDDDIPKTVNPIDLLPPATQIGANTAGCLLNGEAFLQNSKSKLPLSLNYLERKNFALSISREINDVFYNVYIYLGDVELEAGKTYKLTELIDNSSSYSWYYYQNPLPNAFEVHYLTTSSITGEVTITNHDVDNFILSGTFWFDAKFDHLYKLNEAINVNVDIDENEIIEVRDGRFDMIYNI